MEPDGTIYDAGQVVLRYRGVPAHDWHPAALLRVLANSSAMAAPISRLDFNSSGLLLLTNDGALTEQLLHPRYQIPRTYHVKLGGTPTHQALQALRSGVRLDDGTITSPANVRVLRRNEQKVWLEVTLREGRNREVRRMCEAVGHKVDKLIRVSFGPLSLDDLPVGAYRSLSPKEIRGLKQIAGKIKNPS